VCRSCAEAAQEKAVNWSPSVAGVVSFRSERSERHKTDRERERGITPEASSETREWTEGRREKTRRDEG
jgi:hypothetical protein